MQIQAGIIGDAQPKRKSKYRQWLSRTWDKKAPKVLVLGLNPSHATASSDDKTTEMLTEILSGLTGKYSSGGFILVNCCDYRLTPSDELCRVKKPCTIKNHEVIREELRKCKFVVASWGTTKRYGQIKCCLDVATAILKASGKKIVCFSPDGSPIHCGPINHQYPGRWSDKPRLLQAKWLPND